MKNGVFSDAMLISLSFKTRYGSANRNLWRMYLETFLAAMKWNSKLQNYAVIMPIAQELYQIE
jgi:hypothetical protein